MLKEVYSKEESRYLKVGMYVCLCLIGILTYFVISQKKVELDNGKYYSVVFLFDTVKSAKTKTEINIVDYIDGIPVTRVTNFYSALLYIP